MKTFYLIAAVALLFGTGTATAAAQTSPVEIDGVYYTLEGTNAYVQAPPSGQKYTGNFVYTPYVEYEGTKYHVYSNIMYNGPYEIETLTIAEGWDTSEGRYGQQMFRNIPTLKRINVLSATGEERPGAYSRMSISVGNVLDLINLSTIVDDNGTTIRVERFEVYGPDDKRLQPFLIYEGVGTRVYPDENGVFHLGANFRALDGAYCGVFPTTLYTVVYLNVEVNGNLFTIRVEPAPAQGAPVHNVDGLYVQRWANGAHLCPAPEGCEYPEHTVVPASLTIDGVEYPISSIDEKTFDGSPIRELTLMGEYSGYIYVGNCPNLETVTAKRNTGVDMRNNPSLNKINFPAEEEIKRFAILNCDRITAVGIPQGVVTFDVSYSGCANLSSVSIPEGVTSLGSFTDCPLLTELELPESVKYISSLAQNNLTSLAIPHDLKFGYNALSDSKGGLFDIEVVENAEDYVKVRVNSHVTDMAGNVLPVAAAATDMIYGDDFNYIAHQDNGGVLTLNRYATVNGYRYDITEYLFGYDNSKGEYTSGLTVDNLADYTTSRTIRWATLSLPKYESGLAEVEADDSNAPVEYYNLQGIRVETPAGGFYIRRQGRNVTKVIIP